MKPLSKPLQEAFDALWKAYPHPPRDPKAAARDLFSRRVSELADPAEFAAAAQRFAQACRRDKVDPKFIPHCRTWLSQRRYEDFLEEAQPPAAADLAADHPLGAMRGEIGAEAWNSWIAPLTVERRADGAAVLARTRFVRDEVKRRFGTRIEQLLGPVAFATQTEESR
jgi:hypothetical protein